MPVRASLACALASASQALAWIFLLLSAAGRASAADQLPVEAFARLPDHQDVQLSPDGRYAAAMRLVARDRYGVIVYELDTVKPVFVARNEDWDVNWVRWKSGNRLLVSVRQPGRRYGIATLETRLVAMNPDGSDARVLLAPRRDEAQAGKVVQIADEIVSLLPDDPQHILMSFNVDDPRRPKLYRVNIYNDRREQIEGGREFIQWWLADRQGQIRVGRGRDDSAGVEEGYKTWYRPTKRDGWTMLWDNVAQDAYFDPLFFDMSDPDLITVLSDQQNGRAGLFKYRISTRQFTETLFLHPEVDIDSVIYDPRETDVVGVRYVTGITRFEWFSEREAGLYREVRQELPGWEIHLGSRGWDYSRLVIYASASDHAGRYYLYEPATKKLRYFAPTYPELDRANLSRVVQVRFSARDGLEIPAYLTLPRASAFPPTQPLPSIIMPHGGPESRDYAAFDPIVQMLVSAGYAVLQLNFRGSEGYGTEFQEAGRRQWGEAMQDDVTDGTRWLINQKVADPSRICIFGGSYGGYAALMGAVKEPKLYRCSVSLNGVTDLPDLISGRRHYIGGRYNAHRRIGDLWKDRKKLEENSPARRAADIQVPVLLIHGTADRVVPIQQSRKMASALKDAGKNYRFVELEDEEHWLTHGDTRLQFFQELDRFLAQHLQ